MALIDIDSALKEVMDRLARMEAGQGVEVLSYKRNRGVSILRIGEGEVLVKQHGQKERERVWHEDELQHRLGIIFRMEFPRSRKVSVSDLGSVNEEEV